ncbi:hypothetical protein I79_013365 [Cricetulus griseus]|uniref:Uncharacterized protein n=1 Tax=Cricetulus griseus TaxID=10029 RepID=G3HRA0_CRIGR|nr:hypothetical protein I79_013365 [Cricetulus griseus]
MESQLPLKAEQTLQLHELQRRAGGRGWEQQSPSALSGQAASGLAEPSPIPNLSATYPLFLSLNQAGMCFLRGKNEKGSGGRRLKNSNLPFDKGAL